MKTSAKSKVVSASELRLYWRLQLAAHHMQKFADRELLSADKVTTAQIGVLTIIRNQSDLSQKDVARALGLNESAVSAMIRRLVALRYVEFKNSKDDKRVKLLFLTADGLAVQKKAKPPFRRINRRIETVLNDDEIVKLADCLERLQSAFETSG